MRALIVVCLLARAAAAEPPSNTKLVLIGVALAPADYLFGVALHEGSHALAAELVGGNVTEMHLFPPGIDPAVHKFRFGWTYVEGLRTKPQRILFYVAPKITDSLLLGGFTALVLSSAWPTNKYGELVLTVIGTGLWIDFAKDVVLFSPANDVVKVLHQWCMVGWKQLPARLVYAAVAAGFGYAVVRAYEKTFAEPAAATPLVLPVVSSRF